MLKRNIGDTGKKIWRGHILDRFPFFSPRFTGLHGGGGHKSVLGGGVWKIGLGGGVHNPDPLCAQVWSKPVLIGIDKKGLMT